MPGFTAICRLKYICGRAFFVWIRIAVRTGSTLVPVFTAILRLKRCYSNLETQDLTAIWIPTKKARQQKYFSVQIAVKAGSTLVPVFTAI